MSTASVLILFFGILCILYCISIGLFMGYGTKFFLVWGILGVTLCLFSGMISHQLWTDRLPSALKAGILTVIGSGLILFMIIEGLILGQFGAKAQPGADYCLILGAQMKANGPSDVLQRRLDAAVAYLGENPDTKAIVSGGKGVNEPVTEAFGMYEYLVERGIAPDRILLEEESGNTVENLQFSSKFLDPDKDSVVLVTNNFHMFRALGIARKTGYEKISGLAADSYPLMVPNNLLREFLGVIKDGLAGNL